MMDGWKKQTNQNQSDCVEETTTFLGILYQVKYAIAK